MIPGEPRVSGAWWKTEDMSFDVSRDNKGIRALTSKGGQVGLLALETSLYLSQGWNKCHPLSRRGS